LYGDTIEFLPWKRLAESIYTGFFYETILFDCQCAIFAGFFIFLVIDGIIFWWRGKHSKVGPYDPGWRGKKK